MMTLDPKLVQILACPACENRPSLRLDSDKLACDQCHRLYAIQDGIPILLVDEAVIINN